MITNEVLFCIVHILLLLLVLSGCNGNATHSPVAAHSSSTSNISASSLANTSQGIGSNIRYDTIKSNALNANMGFAVYLPAGYNPDERYPVLYIMYGYGGNQYSMFNNFMSVNRVADKMMLQGVMKPMILVVPDYKNSFAVNSTPAQNPNASGGTIGLYEDYLIKELIPYIDRNFSTISTPDGRFVEGYSMGGFAALYLGFNYPGLFSKIGAHSSALWDYSKSDLFIGQRDWLYTTPELRSHRDPFLLAQSQDLRNINIYLDVGNDDPLSDINERFYNHLLKQGIRVQWHNNAGGHNENYWNENVEDYFQFY
jgi:enterochelin esterase-like enzyme